VLIVGAVVSLLPIYWMFLTSFKPANDLFSDLLIPSNVTLDNYRYVWENTPIPRMLWNTFAMSLLVSVCQVAVGIPAAYAFVRWRFFGDRVLLLLLVGTWLVPFQVTMIPNYVLVSQLGWLNSLPGLVVPQITAAFAVVLLRLQMKSVPLELLEAGRLDGASNWGVLWLIIVPNIRAGLSTLGILLFISTWNEYFWPLIVTSQMSQTVIQVGLQMFLSDQGTLWGPLMAASSLASLPVLLIYLVLRRHVLDAFVRSGIR
jgi:multiple sugar transport system permease protein/sn-glycerol 3-phosphate transport system permease protein